jgi:AcrR family transcriptional regulator
MKPNKPATADRIVEAAVQLFSRHGVNGTTTQEIARAANINEGTLFRYFPRKLDLFWAAVHSQLDRMEMRRKLQVHLASDSEPQVVLPLIVEFLVNIVWYQPALLRLLYFSLLELPAEAEPVCSASLGPMFYSISSYLERCVKRGTLRPVNPSVTSVALAMTVIGHGSLFPLISGKSLPYGSADEAIAAYSGLWLTTLVPQNHWPLGPGDSQTDSASKPNFDSD